jgi:hypothetical protein
VVVVVVPVAGVVPEPVGGVSVVSPGVTLLPSEVTVGCSPSPGEFVVDVEAVDVEVVDVDTVEVDTVEVDAAAVGAVASVVDSEEAFFGVSSTAALSLGSGSGTAARRSAVGPPLSAAGIEAADSALTF